MPVKEKMKLICRGYRQIHTLVPGCIAAITAHTVFSIAPIFITIVMSSKIITALAGGLSYRQVLLLVLVTVLLNVLVSLAASGFLSLRNTLYQKLLLVAEEPLNKKILQMDYERVEDTEVHMRREHINTLQQANGMGLTRLIWSYADLIKGLFTALMSVSLLSGAFTTYHSQNAGKWSFLFSPLAVLSVILLIALNTAVSICLTSKSIQKMYHIVSGLVPVNRLASYYYSHLVSYKVGKDLKLYDLSRPFAKEMDTWKGLFTKLTGQVQKSMARYDSLIAATNTVLAGIIYAYVAIKALFGSFGVGGIVQYVGCLAQLSGSISDIMLSITYIDVNTEALRLYFEFIDMPDKKYQGTIPVEKRSDNDYEIEFRKVSFRYPGTEQYALRDLSLKLNIGQRLAVVGMNGSGKTTMIKLLCRLYDPTEGIITLNGIDIKKYSYQEYMAIFSVVFQDFTLFSFSLGQNVAAGIAYDRKKASDALKKAGFAGRLDSLTRGLDTPLYKDFEVDGVEISGGEAQKIALARALYKDAPFIILDEPTAALDPLAEFEVYSKFNDITGDRTAAFISHRLSSCRFCDDIAVFHEGSLVQRGSHQMLIQDEAGKYYQLWNAQAQYYTDKVSAYYR